MIYSLLIISFIIYVAYDVVCLKKAKKVPDNLSDTYYLWANSKYIFPLVLLVASITMAPSWWKCAQEFDHEYLMWVTAIGISAVCIIPDYKSNLWKFLTHIICAYTAGFAAALFIFLVNWVVIISVFIVALTLCLTLDKNKKTTFEFWLEFVVLTSLYILFLFN